jgi:hypothetical protein
MKRVYVSGPMSGLPGLNFQAFHDAASQLRAAGYAALNPAEINPNVETTWLNCMRADIKVLVDCDGVATLPGWEKSRGATLEVEIAERLGLQAAPLNVWLAAAGRAKAA